MTNKVVLRLIVPSTSVNNKDEKKIKIKIKINQ